jgi:periplasmic copper chaperone A
VQEPWARAALAGAQTPAEMGNDSGSMMAATAEGVDSGGMSSDGMAMSGGRSAAYMQIRNGSGTADRLVRASSDVATTVEIHNVIMENDVAQMRPVEAIDVPANGSVELRPGGYHVMLLGLTRDLTPGETVRLTLTFERAGDVQVDAPVREP